MKDRTYGYVRVSTDKQAEDKTVSLKVQRKRIAATCEIKKWNLVGFFADEGKSGDDISRDGLWKMFRHAAKGRMDRIVVAYRDRLMKDAGYLEKALRFFAAVRVEVYLSDMGMGVTADTDFSVEFIVQTLGGMDSMMLKMTRAKVTDALAYLKEEKKIKLGKPPAGFKRASKNSPYKPTKQALEIESLSESPTAIARMKRFKVLKGKHKGKFLNWEQVERIRDNMRDWRDGTLNDRLTQESAAMRKRYKEAQIVKVKKQDRFEAKLAAMIPAEAKIRSSRL